MEATIENMREHYKPGIFAYSPFTDERYSADPGDYWNANPGWAMTDSEGNRMILVTEQTQLLDVIKR